MIRLRTASACSIVVCSLALVFCRGLSAQEPIPGIGPTGSVQRLHTGFAFTEGPASDAEGNLYFTDIPNNRIHKRDATGQVTIFAEPSGHCNGLMVVGDRLLACEMDGRLKQYSLKDATEAVLADKYQDKRFNAPNDLVIDRTGGIYFTDPRFRAPDPWPQGKEAVYYRAADGSVTRLIDDRTAPNGVILSPDEMTLYVIPSMEKQMWAYPVESPGKLGAGRVFCELKQGPEQTNSGGDGLTVDTSGNLYITSSLGLQIFDPSGKALGVIAIPGEQPANVTFGGPERKTLFITARTSLYSVETEATGHIFTGP
ncbi:MAG: SMP-30/gluconolactonase/LRE family protein [Planctomyces sp.]|nr:SMP-30/gluconolactonase/LRE family protein [Planctomyces sp.]